jgi:hypothetical protein
MAEPGQVPPQEPMPPMALHGPRTQPHSPVTGSCTQSSKSDGHVPPHMPAPSGPHGGGKRVVVVEVDVVVVEVDDVTVVVARQPPASHASQQLGTAPTQARPPLGATQRSALGLILHDVLPERRVRQQVTKPGLPHVDFEAHRLTTRTQLLSASTASATSAAHRTYAR